MDQPLDGGVGLFVQRIERQLGMVGDHAGFEREELSHDRIVAWVEPVDAAEDVGAVHVSIYPSFIRGSDRGEESDD